MHLSLVLALLLASAQDDAFNKARKAYSNCIVDAMTEHLDKDASKAEFEAAAQQKCMAQSNKYKAIVVKSEMELDASKTEAEEYAREEIAAVISAWVDSYMDYKNTKTRPTKER